MATLGDRIKSKRKRERLSAEDLAVKLGLKKDNIYKWERGSKPSDPEEFATLTTWLNNSENVPREISVDRPLPDFAGDVTQRITQIEARLEVYELAIADLLSGGKESYRKVNDLRDQVNAVVNRRLDELRKKQ